MVNKVLCVALHTIRRAEDVVNNDYSSLYLMAVMIFRDFCFQTAVHCGPTASYQLFFICFVIFCT